MKRSKWAKWTGQNLTWGATIQIMRGCVEKNPEVVAEAYKRLYEEICLVPPGKEGIQTDYSFHQHGSQLYSGGYGHGFAQDNARFLYYAHETRFAAPETVLAVLVGYLLDGQQWMVYGTGYDLRMTSSRNIRSEICNDEGRKSHHLSDGACYLYKTGEEYQGIFPVWDCSACRELPAVLQTTGAAKERSMQKGRLLLWAVFPMALMASPPWTSGEIAWQYEKPGLSSMM